MDFKNRTFLASLAATAGVVLVAGLGIVALGAQQGPPPGAGPGGQRGPGMHGRGMFGGPGGPGRMGQMMGRGMAQLNLTAAQKADVKKLRQASREATQAIGKRMVAAREALGDAVTADKADEATIRLKAAEVAAVELDAALLRAKMHEQMFALLTPEQRAKAAELRAGGKARFDQMQEKRRGRGGPGGPGGKGGKGGWL
ncbi:MAG: Spy/CpxP family protein refolding chaperone [Acidobacteriota bacterium]